MWGNTNNLKLEFLSSRDPVVKLFSRKITVLSLESLHMLIIFSSLCKPSNYVTLRSIISNFYMMFIWEFSTKTYNILIWDWRVTSVTTESKDKTRLFPYALLRIIKVRLPSLLFIIVNVVPSSVNKMLSETQRRTKKIINTPYRAPFKE